MGVGVIISKSLAFYLSRPKHNHGVFKVNRAEQLLLKVSILGVQKICSSIDAKHKCSKTK